MGARRDALRAAARLIMAVGSLAERATTRDASATGTVGFLEVAPNSPNVIPGDATVVTDLRSADPAVLAGLAHDAGQAARAAADTEGVAVEIGTMLDQAPMTFAPELRAVLRQVVAELAGLDGELASQAGHDAVHLGTLAPAGMLFVRCAGGLSHCPEESVTPEDAAVAAEALLRAILTLDGMLHVAGG
jgi:acetylornithine deacetylase/succinyl-diaminopimelate desuccinylase-like protein